MYRKYWPDRLIQGMHRAFAVLRDQPPPPTHTPPPPTKLPSFSPYSKKRNPPITEPPYPQLQSQPPAAPALCQTAETRGLSNMPRTICERADAVRPPGLLIRTDKGKTASPSSRCTTSSSHSAHIITFSFISISVSFPLSSSRPSWRYAEGQG